MHQQIGMEDVWGNKIWGDGVFTFLFYVTDINTYKLYHHFKECLERSILDFRFELDFQIMLNDLPGSIYNLISSKRRRVVERSVGMNGYLSLIYVENGSGPDG